jgi:hypothetical protein
MLQTKYGKRIDATAEWCPDVYHQHCRLAVYQFSAGWLLRIRTGLCCV